MATHTVFSFTDREGNIISSSGISNVKWDGKGTGKYTITFDSSFNETPAVTLFPSATSGPRYVNGYIVNKSQVSFRWRGADGEPVDEFSNLIVVGKV